MKVGDTVNDRALNYDLFAAAEEPTHECPMDWGEIGPRHCQAPGSEMCKDPAGPRTCGDDTGGVRAIHNRRRQASGPTTPSLGLKDDHLTAAPSSSPRSPPCREGPRA